MMGIAGSLISGGLILGLGPYPVWGTSEKLGSRAQPGSPPKLAGGDGITGSDLRG